MHLPHCRPRPFRMFCFLGFNPGLSSVCPPSACGPGGTNRCCPQTCIKSKSAPNAQKASSHFIQDVEGKKGIESRSTFPQSLLHLLNQNFKKWKVFIDQKVPPLNFIVWEDWARKAGLFSHTLRSSHWVNALQYAFAWGFSWDDLLKTLTFWPSWVWMLVSYHCAK